MIENLQIHTATVQAPITRKGSSGGEKVTWDTTITNMPCRIIDASATWKIFYAQRQLDITHHVFTNQVPTVKAGYQLLWNGKILRVIGIIDLKGKNQVAQIDCQELRNGA